MKLQNLPTGQQDFPTIRLDGLLYVDKTQYIVNLLQEKKQFIFLSRPRRFGKSVFINTLKEVFLGNKQYFQGLFIEDKIAWKPVPVIHLDFSKMDFQSKGLIQAIQDTLDGIGSSCDVSFKQKTIGAKFEELIQSLHTKTGERVAILIDEYDKPITEYLESEESADASRDTLRALYSILKGNSGHIRMVFITGISRFSKLSLFSELNNFTDLSFEKRYHNICGYTKEELESNFSAHLQALANDRGMTYEETLVQMKDWYNGYSWDGVQRVYNPFSVLRCLDSRTFENYWFESGTPKFLIKQFKKKMNFELNHTAVAKATFDNYDIHQLTIETLTFQTGYLTIESIDYLGRYILAYPNKEVEKSMNEYLLMGFSENTLSPGIALNMVDAVMANNMALFIDTVNVLFANIPAEIFLTKQEAYFHSILYISLKLCGFHIHSEVRHSKGRLDAVLKVGHRVYIFEFKLDRSAAEAMKQIKEKEYAKAYLEGEIYLVGINFSSEKKEVDGWLLEKLR